MRNLTSILVKMLIKWKNVYIMDKGYPHETRMMCGCITK